MRRQLGWLCVLPVLASLTSTQAVIAGAYSAPSTQAFPVPDPADVAASAATPALAAGSDYGPATWNPASPANYTVGNRPHSYPVQMIIIHDIEGSYASAISEFQDPTFAASAHYVVSDTGQITQMVAEKDIAWHAGNWDYNTRAIGIEHEGYAWTCCYYTTAMYQASAELAASICSRWGVPMDRQHVIGHDQVPDPNNPGLFGGEDHHTDPGPYWNWTYYMSLAQADAAALPSPPHMTPDPTAVLNSATSATVSWLSSQTCHSPITGYTVMGQPGNLVMNLPAGSNMAMFTGLQAGVTYTFTVTATNADGQDTQTAHWQCQAQQAGASPASPQPSATAVTFSAGASGCPNPRYQFLMLAPGSTTWVTVQRYSSNATFSWNTAGDPAGTYLYTVWVRDASSIYLLDAYVPGTAYTLTTQPCTSVTASAAPASPQVSGTTVQLTAAATGCTHPLYEFWTLAPGGSWTIGQAYSSSATFGWNTAGKTAGTYLYTVWVRDASSTANLDAYFPGTAYTLMPTACTAVTASAAPASTQRVGTVVNLTALAAGCPNPQYQFWILPPGGTWTIVQAYSSTATFTWHTIGDPAATYLWTVWVRDASSTANLDTYAPGTAYRLS